MNTSSPLDLDLTQTAAAAGVDECIVTANVDFANDIEHHLTWLEGQKRGASALWAKDEIATLAAYLANHEEVADFVDSLPMGLSTK